MPRRQRARSPLIINPTLQLTVIAEVSRRGHGRAQITVTDPQAVRALAAGVTGGRPVALPRSSRRRLVEDGLLVRSQDVPADVHLEAPLERAAPRKAAMPLRLKVAAGTMVVRGPSLPPAVARVTRNSEPFLPAVDILWVRDPGSGIAAPYTIRPGVARAVAQALVAPGAGAPSIAALLHGVGALLTPGEAGARRRAWQARVGAWQAELRRNGGVALRDLLPPGLPEALRRYYRDLEGEGYLYAGEMRAQGLPLLHGEPVLEFLAGQLAMTVRAITQEPLKPSFTPYLRVYDPGAILDRHHDRPVCRWNLDLVVGGDPAPARGTAWPLWIEHKGRAHNVRLGLGEAVLYRGTEVSHWRRPHPRQATTAVASLHYGAPPRG